MDLVGKKVLVTGGGRRVGRAIVREMARRGADCIIHYRRSASEAEETASEVRAAGRAARTVAADLGTAEGVATLVEEARAAFGRVDVLVNNASLYRPTPLAEVGEADWDEQMAVNAKAPFLCSVSLGRSMKEQGAGKIINVADWASERPYPGFLAYSVSKAALIGLTRALAVELAPQVQVNALLPGPVLAPEGLSRDQVRSIPVANLMGRMGSPSDVAEAAAFLVGSDFITGALLPVDGGRLLAP